MDKVLSLDVGGSFIKYAIINSRYEILSQNKIDTPTVYNDFIYAVKDIVKSVKDEIHVEVCNECHPFYTGAQGKTKKTGNIEKFNKKYGFNKEQ